MKNLDFLKEKYIIHRGLINYNYKENSLNAFKDCLKSNNIIELDVHLTNEGELVIIHDNNLKRVYNSNIEVKNLTKKDIVKYNIPTLKEVLSLVNGKNPLIIEIKKEGNEKVEENVLNLLKDYKGKYVIKSFNINTIKWFKKNAPSIIRGVLFSYKKFSFTKFIYSIIVCRPDFISVDYKLLNNKLIKNFRKKRPVLSWTYKNSVKDKYLTLSDNFIVENIVNKM